MENDKNLLPTNKINNSLTKNTEDLLKKIVDENNIDTLKDLTNLFNLNQNKKNILRIAEMNGLMDKVNEQAIKRFSERPDEISNKELLDYMNSVFNIIDKSQKNLKDVDIVPMIQINNQSTDVNISLDDKDSKDRVLDVVKQLLELSKNKDNDSDIKIIEPELVDKGELNE